MSVMCMWFSFLYFFSSHFSSLSLSLSSVLSLDSWAFVKYTIYFLMIVLCFVLFFLLSFCLTFTCASFDVFVMLCYRFNLAHCLILIWLRRVRLLILLLFSSVFCFILCQCARTSSGFDSTVFYSFCNHVRYPHTHTHTRTGSPVNRKL